MAGDWIPIGVDLPYKPEVAKIAEEMRRSADEIVGLLVRFWCWAQAHSSDGVFPGCTPETLAKSARVSASLLRAMESVGWLIVSEDGVTIPNFDRWFSNGAKRRLRTADRVARSRLKRAKEANGNPNVGGNGDVTLGALQERYQRREEERVEESASADSSPPISPPRQRGVRDIDWSAVVFPAGVDDTPQLRESIREWLEYRRRIGKPYRLAEKQVSLLLRRYGAAITEAINHSMAMGWQGCFLPDKDPANGRYTAGPGQRNSDDAANRAW